MNDKHWNRCDECGRFISLKHFENRTARRVFALPDSHFTAETYETLCGKHNRKRAKEGQA